MPYAAGLGPRPVTSRGAGWVVFGAGGHARSVVDVLERPASPWWPSPATPVVADGTSTCSTTRTRPSSGWSPRACAPSSASGAAVSGWRPAAARADCRSRLGAKCTLDLGRRRRASHSSSAVRAGGRRCQRDGLAAGDVGATGRWSWSTPTSAPPPDWASVSSSTRQRSSSTTASSATAPRRAGARAPRRCPGRHRHVRRGARGSCPESRLGADVMIGAGPS